MRALEVKVDGKLRCRIGQENARNLSFLLNGSSISEMKMKLQASFLSEKEATWDIAEWLVEELNLD